MDKTGTATVSYPTAVVLNGAADRLGEFPRAARCGLLSDLHKPLHGRFGNAEYFPRRFALINR